MSSARSFIAVALAALATASSASARQQQAGGASDLAVERHAEGTPPGDVRARASLSRTALWVGDRVSYELEIACAPNVDVLADDLLPDKLALSGLEVVSTDRERRAQSAGGVTYRVRYQLTAYDIAAPTLRIGDLSVRYYVRRAGQRVEDAAPSGEVRIGGSLLALRSTLPDDRAAVSLRDAREAAPLPASVTFARPVGLALVVFSAAPLALWAAALARRALATRGQGRERARQARDVTRSALEELHALDVSKDAGRRAAYDRLNALLRQQLALAAGIPARALTGTEIAARLSASGSGLPAEAVGAVLEDCERARYGPAGVLPSEERFRSGVKALEQLLAGAR